MVVRKVVKRAETKVAGRVGRLADRLDVPLVGLKVVPKVVVMVALMDTKMADYWATESAGKMADLSVSTLAAL